MEEKNVKNNKLKIITTLLIVLCALFVVGLTSYAAFSINIPGISNIISRPAKVELSYIEQEEALISDSFGLSILEGKTQNNYFEFTVSSTSEVNMNIPYNIYITEEETNTLDREKIYVYITEVVDGEEIEVLHPQKLIYFSDYYKYENSYILTNDNFRFTSNTEETLSRTYRLRIWVDAEANAITNEDGSQSINIEGGTYEYKVHVDTNVAPEYCFAYTIDETTNEATITDYYCHSDNTYGYETITDLIIPTKLNEANVTTINQLAFQKNNLTTVVISNKVKTVGHHAFAENEFNNITIGGNIIEIESAAFYKNRLSKIIISDMVTSLSNSFNRNLMPDEEAYIYARTDENGDGIAEIDYTSIRSYAGANKEPIIPEGITTLEYESFYYSQLVNITFPSTLKIMLPRSLSVNNLEKLVIPDSVQYIKDEVFSFNNLNYVYISENSSLIEISSNAFSSSNRKDSVLDNPNLTTIYNNSGKSFDFQYAVNGTEGTPFITGTVPSYTDSSGNIYNEVTVTTGYPS